jgi:hypothetical protein
MLSWCSIGGRYWPNDWIVWGRWWRHSRCVWRWRPISSELLRVEHFKSTIPSLGEIICLPRWPITQKALESTRAWLWASCHVEWGIVVALGSARKWWLQGWVTIPRWSMNLICEVPELWEFARYLSSIIMWCSHIVMWALLWTKQPTRCSHIGWLRRKSVCWHHMGTKRWE